MTKLNLGCGPIHPSGWINVDGSMRAWLVCRAPLLDRMAVALGVLPATDFADVEFHRLHRKWPWADQSVEAIYAGELLEHFERPMAEFFLGECFRVLRSGGIVRLRVPDNVKFWASYLSEYHATKLRDRSEWTHTHSRWIEMFFRDICVRRTWLGSYGHFHKWMYDDVSLVLTVEQAGFEHVECRSFLDSAIPDVASVELRNNLIVEGVRP